MHPAAYDGYPFAARRSVRRGRAADLSGCTFIHVRLRSQNQSIPAVLRSIVTSHPRFGPVDLMDYLATVFDLSWDDVRCLGGWWHDGTGELDDEAIERRIAPKIHARRPAWDTRAKK